MCSLGKKKSLFLRIHQAQFPDLQVLYYFAENLKPQENLWGCHQVASGAMGIAWQIRGGLYLFWSKDYCFTFIGWQWLRAYNLPRQACLGEMSPQVRRVKPSCSPLLSPETRKVHLSLRWLLFFMMPSLRLSCFHKWNDSYGPEGRWADAILSL